ncbi:MAG TPA: phospholipid carrier-dependent glycosyltransferase, partial [Candidatus Sulfomarinibacteraceae bacterium]|nr:phospholipid carrier-dependent glycosyltransferase [Candidatus Sulfomarinibacteraceae bacterium]
VLFLILRSGFDGLYGQDAFAYFDYAVGPLRRALPAGEWPPPFFWPPGYPLLVALASLVLGPVPAAGQMVSLVAGALVPLFTVLIARELMPEREYEDGERRHRSQPADAGKTPALQARAPVALLAGLLVAANGQLWQSSAVVMSDTTALLAATAGVWALLRYGRGRGPGWLWLAAAAVAFAVLTRWAYALLAIPCAAYALVVLWRRPRRAAVWHAAGAVLLALLVLSPVIRAAWLAGQGGDARFLGNFAVYSWHPLNALRREFVTAGDGLLSYDWPNGLYYALAPGHRYYFTPLLAPLLLPGVWAMGRQKRRAAAFLLLAWAALIYDFHAGAPYQNFRFTLAYLPPLAIFAALGAGWLLRRLPRALSALLPLALLAGLLWMVAGGYTLTGDFMARKAADLDTVRWVEQQAELETQPETQPGVRLFTFNITFTFQRYSRLETHDLYFLTPEEMSRLLAQGGPGYVLVDVENVLGQWAGRAPEDNLAWLQQNVGLEPLGRHRQYTLFRLQQGSGP